MRFRQQRLHPALRLIASLLLGLFDALGRARRAIKGCATADLFGSRGRNFVFDPDGIYSYASIHIGDDVNLGTKPTILAPRSRILIGNHVVFGPCVTIRGGNHRFDLVGRYIDDVGNDEKRPEDDKGVVIEDDVWVGGNATILHGVTIGRGSVIAASAVVTRSIPPYSIAAGNPARIVRERFDADQIRRHEALLREQDL